MNRLRNLLRNWLGINELELKKVDRATHTLVWNWAYPKMMKEAGDVQRQ